MQRLFTAIAATACAASFVALGASVYHATSDTRRVDADITVLERRSPGPHYGGYLIDPATGRRVVDKVTFDEVNRYGLVPSNALERWEDR